MILRYFHPWGSFDVTTVLDEPALRRHAERLASAHGFFRRIEALTDAGQRLFETSVPPTPKSRNTFDLLEEILR